MTRRAPGEKLEGYWEFPGGKLEPGEDPQACIVRELIEELGVESAAGEVITEAAYEYPGGVINLIAVQVTATPLSLNDRERAILGRHLRTNAYASRRECLLTCVEDAQRVSGLLHPDFRAEVAPA